MFLKWKNSNRATERKKTEQETYYAKIIKKVLGNQNGRQAHQADNKGKTKKCTVHT